MPDILHKVEVKASPNDVYRALTHRDRLASWWTTDTRGDTDKGGVIQFRFGSRGAIDVKVVELEPARRVTWEVMAGPAAWLGTRLAFELRPAGDFTAVLFQHQGWKEPVEFMHHCSTKWAMFLMSFKSLLESGQGAPYPDDVHITGTGD
jgi:uncharacterized protein YndB with AHSA1/START domain